MFDCFELAVNPASGRLAMSLVDLCAGRGGMAKGTAADPPSFIGAVGVQTGGAAVVQRR